MGTSQVTLVAKNPPVNEGDTRDAKFDHWVKKISWNRKLDHIPVFLPRQFHGQRSFGRLKYTTILPLTVK